MCRELEDPGSELAKLCGFSEGKKPPDRKTIANHFLRIGQHPELVNDVVSEIKQYAPYASRDAESPKPTKAEKAEKGKKAQKESHRDEESEPSKRNKENVDYRLLRRKEAVGKRELDPIVATEDTSKDFVSPAIHGGGRICNKCKEKKAQGWKCKKEHVHEVIVEVQAGQGQRRQKCRCCESKLSVTSGTIFHGTNFSCQEILLALHEMVKSRTGVSALHVAGVLNENGRNVSEDAAHMLMHRFRECMREDKPGRFGGETEVDEMLLRLDNGRLVSIVTLYNRPTRCVKWEIVEREGGKKPKAKKREMLQFIRKHTLLGSTIVSDGDASIPKPSVMKRKHAVIFHKGPDGRQFLKYSDLDGALDKEMEVTTNRAEGKQGFFRLTLHGRNGISRHHLERYLMEAAWRSNHLHNKLESQNYEGEERRNLSLMRDVLAGAAGRKLTLRDLRGEPQEKRDRTLEKERTAPVTAPATPRQMPLTPVEPIVPGASQSASGRVEVKPQQATPGSQSQRGQVKVKSHPTGPTQLPLALGASQTEDEQARPVSPDETTVGSKGEESGLLEELEQIVAAVTPQREGLGRRPDPVAAL